DAQGELVLAQIFPDVFDRVEFRRIGRQVNQGDVVRDHEFARDMPSGSVQKKSRVAALRNALCGTGLALGADGTKNVGGFIAGIAGSTRSRSATRPKARERAFLSDPRLVLEPDFEWLVACLLG